MGLFDFLKKNGKASDLSWNIKGGTLTISGKGAIPDYSTTRIIDKECTTAPWGSHRRSITSVLIENGVTSIGICAFTGCDSFTSVIIPNSVTSISSCAFAYCDKLISITIPDSIVSIESAAFLQCTGLTSVTLPNSITSIKYMAFAACIRLTNLAIPNSVTSIEDVAFANCASLTNVSIPDSVTTIKRGAFSECLQLTSIVIPNSVTSIGEEAFKGCIRLTSVTIPDSVKYMGNNIFEGCSSLSSVTNPDSMTSNEKKASILEKYREGLSYLDGSGAFDEDKLREFNRITGNMLSNDDIENYLESAKLMIRGMEEVKQILRSTMVEGISVFEEVERNGIDLSKYEV